MDPATTKMFINYAQIVVARYQPSRSGEVPSCFWCLSRRLSEWESVSARCQPFATRRNRTGIVLLDISHGRALRFGSPMPDEQFEKVIQSIRTAR